MSLAGIENEDQLELALSEPGPEAIAAMRDVPGDIALLGCGGKMGPTLARMALRATEAAGVSRRVIAVSRFSDAAVRDRLESWGVETCSGDLLDEEFLRSLPDVPNVIYMAGRKFGAAGNLPLTWAMNVHLPALVAQRYSDSRLIAFSTGNVYGTVDRRTGGSVESDEPNPVGEYAMSCLGRERMFQHFSDVQSTPTVLLRLNYACEFRYGVLVDLAEQVASGQTIDLAMSYVNVIWQGDANSRTLAALPLAESPAKLLNLAGPEILRVRDVCERLGELLGHPVRFTGDENDDALLNSAVEADAQWGPPRVGVDDLLQGIAAWLQRGGERLGKPTHFEVRDGTF
ncbi:NAD-dependent epimerase/dehydratase family protein [Maioricimonas sp. JC845]|uniref:NAD-dependent epimerase/dehydratase family protein n=1 Tax=Maioricimonas sp. JC845 TaxID=3232138 RepID=UPI003459A763